MPRTRPILLAGVLPLLLAACIQSSERITLNPDGSGKSEFEIVPAEMALDVFTTGSDSTPGPDPAKKAMQKMLDEARGVDAWAELRSVAPEDGPVRIRGTAYFRDVSKYRVGDGSDLDIAWSRDGSGDMVLEVLPVKPAPGVTETTATAPADSVIESRIRSARSGWRASRPLMAALLDSLRFEKIFVLPGRVAEASGLQPTPGGVRFLLAGSKIVEAKDRLMADEAMLRATIRAGRDPDDGPDEATMSEFLFGTRTGIRARVRGSLAPLFDYAAEAGAARRAMPGMLSRLGLEAPAETPGVLDPAPGGR